MQAGYKLTSRHSLLTVWWSNNRMIIDDSTTQCVNGVNPINQFPLIWGTDACWIPDLQLQKSSSLYQPGSVRAFTSAKCTASSPRTQLSPRCLPPSILWLRLFQNDSQFFIDLLQHQQCSIFRFPAEVVIQSFCGWLDTFGTAKPKFDLTEIPDYLFLCFESGLLMSMYNSTLVTSYNILHWLTSSTGGSGWQTGTH